jgi:hypothetical protein
MKIVVSHLANRVGSIKLPDGQHKQFEKDTLKKLFRVQIPGSAGEEITLYRQWLPSLIASVAQGKDWELSKCH